jgi:hypothetical protein
MLVGRVAPSAVGAWWAEIGSSDNYGASIARGRAYALNLVAGTAREAVLEQCSGESSICDPVPGGVEVSEPASTACAEKGLQGGIDGLRDYSRNNGKTKRHMQK